jgi:hypothetical protein
MSKTTADVVVENWATIAPELGLDGTDPPDTFHNCDCQFDSGPGEWLVGTDEEADEFVREYIEDSLWAFLPAFLSSATGLDEKIFNAFVKAELCEDANEAIEALVKHTCGMDRFVDEAVTADGRGHFLSSYDGEEREIKVGDTYLYFYRVN